MSQSDFTISSPRKGQGTKNGKDSYDDDFKKFLNDVKIKLIS